jgi:hypothetical protein
MSTTAEPKEMTMFEWQAWAIENAADSLAFWIDKTADDKASWKPAMEGSTHTRSALELGSECVGVNRSMAAMFRGDTPKGDSQEYKDKAECIKELVASGRELGDAVRGMKAEDVDRTFQTPFGPLPGRMLLQIALGNLQYHGGQVNLIQLLYGDSKFYIPGRD